MKKHLSKLLSIVFPICFITSLAACGGDSKGNEENGGDTPNQVFNFSFTMHDPSTSAKYKYYEQLAEQTRIATNGGINITMYPGGTLVAGTDVAEGILSGAADIGWLYTGFFPGQFPLTEALLLPLIMENHVQGTNAFLDLYDEFPELQEELSMYKVLGIYCNPMAHIYTTQPVYSADDLTGMSLRCPAGVATDMLARWGATPILMGPGDVYQSVEKGVINGFSFEWSGVGSFNLQEVVNYCIEIPFYVGEFVIAMNLDKWNSLPEEYQAIMEEIWCSREASLGIAEVFVKDNELARNIGIEANVEIITPTEEQLASFQPAADQYISEWIENHTTDTFDAEQYFNRMIEVLEQYAP